MFGVLACLVSNCGEFAIIKIGIVNTLLHAKEFHRVSIAKPIGHKEIAIFGFQHICNADVILTVYIRDCYLRVLDCYLCHIAFSYSRPTWGILCTKIRRIIESKTFLNENLHKTAQNRLIVSFDWHKFLSSECNECLHFCYLTGWTALCSLLSGRQQGSVKPTAGRRVTISREGVSGNTFGVIKNTPRVFKISFGVLNFSAGKLGV